MNGRLGMLFLAISLATSSVLKNVSTDNDLGLVRIEASLDGGATLVAFNGAQIAPGLILTCGHCCRAAGGQGARVHVGIVSGETWRVYRSTPGSVLCFDMNSDVGLIQIGDPQALKTIYELAPRGTPMLPGQRTIVYRWQSNPERLSPAHGQITRVNPYDGPATVEITTMPRGGESGGPLVLTDARQIAGVTSAADVYSGRGISSGLDAIYQLIDQCGQSAHFQESTP